MMKNKRTKNSITAIARDSIELANLLGLKGDDAIAMEFRAKLNHQLAKLMQSSQLTHAELAARTGASRTRVTAILNGHTQGVSTDFLLRLLAALGCKTVPTFTKTKSAA
jgi:predicted XRE-type DNA-binding protein